MIRILLADDHTVLRAGLRVLLERQPGFQVVAEARDGRETVELVETHNPDVILLDMNLPDIDGLELLRHLKADPATAGIAVIVVSADALPSQIDLALDAGALRYLTKPVSVSELLRVLDETLHTTNSRLDQGFPP